MPQVRQGGIVVDAAHELPVPKTAHQALERSARIDKGIKQTHVAMHQPYHDGTHDGHPALNHLDGAEHVTDVFPHPTHPHKHKF